MKETNETRLAAWLKSNPDGYYSLPMKQIADDSGASVGAATRILPVLIAKRDGILPSEVKNRRFMNTQSRIDREKLWKLRSKGLPITDIAYLLDCNEDSVRDILRKESPPVDLE